MVVEMYYTPDETAFLVRLHVKTVLKLLHAGELGPVVNLGGEHRPDYRITAHGINAYLERNLVGAPGVPARSVGELRRKVKKHTAPSFGTGGIAATHHPED